jgi:hypothetical protein
MEGLQALQAAAAPRAAEALRVTATQVQRAAAEPRARVAELPALQGPAEPEAATRALEMRASPSPTS